jgi:hypothetical protein
MVMGMTGSSGFIRSAVLQQHLHAGLPLTESRISVLVNRCPYPITRIERELDYRVAVPTVDGIARIFAWRRAA